MTFFSCQNGGGGAGQKEGKEMRKEKNLLVVLISLLVFVNRERTVRKEAMQNVSGAAAGQEPQKPPGSQMGRLEAPDVLGYLPASCHECLVSKGQIFNRSPRAVFLLSPLSFQAQCLKR